MQLRLTLTVHHEGKSVWAEVTELPGCFAEGKDLDELQEAISEAVTLYLEDLSQEEINHLLGHDDDPVDLVPSQAAVLPFRRANRHRDSVVTTVDSMSMLVEA